MVEEASKPQAPHGPAGADGNPAFRMMGSFPFLLDAGQRNILLMPHSCRPSSTQQDKASLSKLAHIFGRHRHMDQRLGV